jgi:hypothetical protein
MSTHGLNSFGEIEGTVGGLFRETNAESAAICQQTIVGIRAGGSKTDSLRIQINPVASIPSSLRK